MVAREVREYRRAEDQAVDAPLIETVRGNFHRDAGGAALDQRRERGLQVDRTRRREISRLTVDPVARGIHCPQRADRAHRPQRAHHVARQEYRCRLAVRPRDADQLQPCRRAAVPRLGGDRRRTPAIANQDLRNRDPGLPRLDQRGRGSACRSVAHKRVPIQHGAAHCAKQHAGREPARVGAEAGDFRQCASPGIRLVDQHAGARERVDHFLKRSAHRRNGGGSANIVTVDPAAA